MNDAVEPWSKISSRVLADCRIFTVNEDTAVSPVTQQEHRFYSLQTVDWCNVVPITADNELVCVRQFRHGSQRITLEIPGGMVDEGESPATAAARECREEAGYAVGDLVSLGVLNPNPAIFPNRLHTWLAPQVVHAGVVANGDATEHTEVQLVPMSQVPDLLLSGEIDHALVVATLWRALHVLNAAGLR